MRTSQMLEQAGELLNLSQCGAGCCKIEDCLLAAMVAPLLSKQADVPTKKPLVETNGFLSFHKPSD